MRRLLEPVRIRPGTLIALIALALSLGGVAYAAIGPNSIHSSNIAPKAVKTGDLGGNAVTSEKIAPGAVVAKKLAEGAVLTPKLADRAVSGAKLGLTTNYEVQPLPDDGTVQYVLAYCDQGQKVIGGGFYFDPINVADLTLLGSFAGHNCPGSRGDCWIVSAANPPGGTGTASVTASAMCV